MTTPHTAPDSDDLDVLIEEQKADPEFAAAYEEAERRSAPRRNR